MVAEDALAACEIDSRELAVLDVLFRGRIPLSQAGIAHKLRRGPDIGDANHTVALEEGPRVRADGSPGREGSIRATHPAGEGTP
jgi:hypothetical protein